MPRSHVRRRDTSSNDQRRALKREKFLSWLEEEEVTPKNDNNEKTNDEAGSIDELSDSQIKRLLYDELEKGPEVGGQFDSVVRWDNRGGGQSVSITSDDNTDWDSLLESLGGSSTSSKDQDGHDPKLVENQLGVYDSDDELSEAIDDIEKEFENCVQEYGRKLYSSFVTGRHRYLSIVVVPPRSVGIDRVIEELGRLVEQYPPNHWYIYASHGDHVHIGHICAYTNESCRCVWIRNSNNIAKYRKRQLRRITRAVNLQPSDYACILRYLCSSSRFIEGVGGFNEYERLCDRYKYLSVCIIKLYYDSKKRIYKRKFPSYEHF